MAEPFLGEIRQMSFNFPPKDWAPCDGQLLQITPNQALYNLIGTKFGGDGQTTFGLPDLRGRTPIHAGNGYQVGQAGGEQTHTLSTAELPQHGHSVAAQTSANGGQATPLENFLGGANNAYATPNGNLQALRADTVASTGGTQAHENMQPYLNTSFCIALQGLQPPPS
jgi:microcystin-dependent protein